MERLAALLENITKSQEYLYENTLPLLDQKIIYLFEKIRDCPDYEEANFYFNSLQEIQEALESLVCKYQIVLPDRLSKFVSQCYRLDEQRSREWLFNKLKYKNYTLENL